MTKTNSPDIEISSQMMPQHMFRKWPVIKPKILIVTCMKNEGPFILEWVAWHKAIGVTDFVVYTNDSNDGTVEILDRLQELGHITHLENPAVALRSSYFQPFALKSIHQTPEFEAADFVISMDVDEFINVRCGEGTLQSLFETVGEFDVLSMSELNHGSNEREVFEPGWVTEQFPRHQSETPGRWKAARGVKSITRRSEKIHQIRNHRPDVAIEAIWVDGAGRSINVLHEDGTQNGIDTRGTYEHVLLEHFPLRSLHSYLIKMDRGDVVVKNKMVSERYWRQRNQNGEATSNLARGIALAREFAHEFFEKDKELMALQRKADAAHAERIAEIKDVEPYRTRRNWILENSW